MNKLIGPDRRWVVAQLSLLTLSVAGGLLELAFRGRGFTLLSPRISLLGGAVLVSLSAAVLVRAKNDLADNLTMSPTPVDGGELVDRGIYSVVRHPMYLGVLLSMFGFILLSGSWWALVFALLLIPFFFTKSHHEEALLMVRYPSYADYRRRVRSRFVPWVL